MDFQKILMIMEKYQKKLNDSIKENRFDVLSELLRDENNNKVMNSCDSKKFYITVKPIRKNPLIFCSGKGCFKSSSKIYRYEDLIRTTCCNFHLYCKECLRNHIITRISTERAEEISCEACAELLIKNELKMKKEEYMLFISIEEKETCLKTGLESQYFKTCQNGYENCRYRTKPLLCSDTIKFNCCENICKQCFGLNCELYLRKKFKKIENSPSKLDKQILGIMCPNEHIKSIKHYNTDQILSIIEFSPSTTESKNLIKDKLKNYIHLFQDGLLRICSVCKNLVLLKGTTKCNNCSRCVDCGNISHDELTCNEFIILVNKKINLSGTSFAQKIKDETHKDYPKFSKAVELMKHFNMKHLKIHTFIMPEQDGLKEFLNSRLLRTYDTQNSYFFSPPFDNKDDLFEFYEEIKKEEGFCVLPFVPSPVNKTCFFIIYKVYFKGDLISRRPRAEDLTDEPLIYIYNQQLYIPNQNSILPFIFIYVGPAIEKTLDNK